MSACSSSVVSITRKHNRIIASRRHYYRRRRCQHLVNHTISWCTLRYVTSKKSPRAKIITMTRVLFMLVNDTPNIGRGTNVVSSPTILSIINGITMILARERSYTSWQRLFSTTMLVHKQKYKTRPQPQVGPTLVPVRLHVRAWMEMNSIWIQACKKNDYSMQEHRHHVGNSVRRENASSIDNKNCQLCGKPNVHVSHSFNAQDNELHALHTRAWEQKYKDAINETRRCVKSGSKKT